MARGFLAKPLEHLAERFLRCRPELREAFALDVAEAGLLQIRQLLDVLLEPECAFQCTQKIVELDAEAAGFAQCTAEQGEAAVDARLLTGHAGRRFVVRTRIGDAATDDMAVLVQQHGLGGGRAQINSDKGLHHAPP